MPGPLLGLEWPVGSMPVLAPIEHPSGTCVRESVGPIRPPLQQSWWELMKAETRRDEMRNGYFVCFVVCEEFKLTSIAK